jgi:ubiquitin-conjugating enzyme E2 D/E
MEFPSNYPEEPPNINFITKIYHPNISPNDGKICISSKSTDWVNHKNLVNVIISIFDLLQKPNTDHGLNNEALLLYKNNKEEFEKKAREFTKKNAFSLCE